MSAPMCWIVEQYHGHQRDYTGSWPGYDTMRAFANEVDARAFAAKYAHFHARVVAYPYIPENSKVMPCD